MQQYDFEFRMHVLYRFNALNSTFFTSPKFEDSYIRMMEYIGTLSDLFRYRSLLQDIGINSRAVAAARRQVG